MLVSSKIKSLLHYKRKRSYTSETLCNLHNGNFLSCQITLELIKICGFVKLMLVLGNLTAVVLFVLSHCS